MGGPHAVGVERIELLNLRRFHSGPHAVGVELHSVYGARVLDGGPRAVGVKPCGEKSAGGSIEWSPRSGVERSIRK